MIIFIVVPNAILHEQDTLTETRHDAHSR